MKTKLPILALGFAAALLLGANEPIGSKTIPGDPYGRVGADSIAVATSVGTNAECTLGSAAVGAGCAVYSYGSTVNVRSEGTCGCFWTHRTITAVGSQTTEQRTLITTAAGSATGRGETFAAGQASPMMPIAEVLSEGDTVAWTGTWCSGTVTGFGGGAVYPPCANTGECTALGAGTCTRTSPLGGGARLECLCAVAAFVHVGLKR